MYIKQSRQNDLLNPITVLLCHFNGFTLQI